MPRISNISNKELFDKIFWAEGSKIILIKETVHLKETDSDTIRILEKLYQDENNHITTLRTILDNLLIGGLDKVPYVVFRDLEYSYKRNKCKIKALWRLFKKEKKLIKLYKKAIKKENSDWLEENYKNLPKEFFRYIVSILEDEKLHKKRLGELIENKRKLDQCFDYIEPDFMKLKKDVKKIKKEIEGSVELKKKVFFLKTKEKAQKIEKNLKDIEDVSINQLYINEGISIYEIIISGGKWISEKGWD